MERNQWQISRRMALSPGCIFFTRCGWNGYKLSSFNVRHTRVRETPRLVESIRVLVVGLRCTISRMFSCSFTCCWRACSDETWALGRVPHSRNVLNTFWKHFTIRHSAHRKPSTVFFNSSTTIAEPVNVQYISVFGIYEDVRHFGQHSYNVTINSRNGQLTLHTDSRFIHWRSTAGGKNNIVR